jgi:hypothetical protein
MNMRGNGLYYHRAERGENEPSPRGTCLERLARLNKMPNHTQSHNILGDLYSSLQHHCLILSIIIKLLLLYYFFSVLSANNSTVTRFEGGKEKRTCANEEEDSDCFSPTSTVLPTLL